MNFLGRKFDPEHLKLLSPVERKLFEKSMRMLVGGESFLDYCLRIAPHEPPPKHVMPVIDAIQQARIKPLCVVIDMGPGHAKTTYLQRGIAWWLQPDQSPADLCAYLTHSDGQARDKSRIAKEAYELGGGTFDESKDGDGYWLTDKGGGLVSKGAQAGIMGKRVPGLLIYDDPYKDVSEARSPAINGKIIERFKAAGYTRLQGGSAFVMHTRYAMDDLIGYILRQLKWDHISIPTICDSTNDVLGRKPGEAAWPERYPYEICTKPCGHDAHIKDVEKTLGPHLFAAMYQGKPRPEGQQLFHEPARFKLKDFSWTDKRGVISIDPAATAKTSSDWSVIMTVAMEGFGTASKMYIVDCVRIQVEIPQLVERARRIQYEKRLMIACEAVAGFKAVPQSLRAMDAKIRVIDVNPGSRDKFVRALPLSAAWNDARVLVPIDAPWADTLLEEFTRFTGNNDLHDDQVDAGSQAWNILYRAAKKITESDYSQSSGV
jgi:predicted phage terminase large subunit-like protein